MVFATSYFIILRIGGFWDFWGFCCFILCRFENCWVFGVFATSYFIILRIGGFLGFLLLHTLSF